MVTGRPCSLLKLRALAVTRRVGASAAAIRSLVVVFPTLPVIPTTGMSNRRRAQAASVMRAAAVSSTTIAVPARGGSDVR